MSTPETPESPQFQAAETQEPPADPPATGEGEDTPLGPKGENALRAMKDQVKELKAELGQYRSVDVSGMTTELEELRHFKAKAEGREKEFAEQQKQREIEAEALGKANERILKAEVRAVAANKLATPEDALLFLDLSKFEVGSDGEVKSSVIASAIDALIEERPYLSAQGKRFQGTGDGGPRNGSTQKSQLTRDDLKGMSPDQINAAREDGRLDRLMGKTA